MNFQRQRRPYPLMGTKLYAHTHGPSHSNLIGRPPVKPEKTGPQVGEKSLCELNSRFQQMYERKKVFDKFVKMCKSFNLHAERQAGRSFQPADQEKSI